MDPKAHPLHAAAITALVYGATRNTKLSAGVGASVLVYMLLWGHGPPTSLPAFELAPADDPTTPQIVLQGFQPRRRRLEVRD